MRLIDNPDEPFPRYGVERAFAYGTEKHVELKKYVYDNDGYEHRGCFWFKTPEERNMFVSYLTLRYGLL